MAGTALLGQFLTADLMPFFILSAIFSSSLIMRTAKTIHPDLKNKLPDLMGPCHAKVGWEFWATLYQQNKQLLSD